MGARMSRMRSSGLSQFPMPIGRMPPAATPHWAHLDTSPEAEPARLPATRPVGCGRYVAPASGRPCRKRPRLPGGARTEAVSRCSPLTPTPPMNLPAPALPRREWIRPCRTTGVLGAPSPSWNGGEVRQVKSRSKIVEAPLFPAPRSCLAGRGRRGCVVARMRSRTRWAFDLAACRRSRREGEVQGLKSRQLAGRWFSPLLRGREREPT